MSQTQSSFRTVRIRWAPARSVVLTLWGLLLLFSLYNAQGVRDEVDKNDFLRSQTWLRDGLTQLMRLSDAVGISALRASLDQLRGAVNAPYTVLTASEVDVPADANPDAPPPPVRPEDLVHRTAKRPRRVLIIGASSIQFAIGIELEKRLNKFYSGLKVKRFGQLATGLSRPDFMNWPDKLRALAKPFKPDLIICNFGGNDAQAIPVDDYKRVAYDSEEWEAKYAEKIEEMIDIGSEFGADTVMIGMPIMRSPKFSKKMRRLNRVMKAATEGRGMLFVSTYEMASEPDGRYRREIEYEGKRGLMRTSDGVHYTRLGGRFIVDQVMQAVERRYTFDVGSEAFARAERHGFESKITEGLFWYTAYVPEGLTERRPAVVILPGQQDAWTEWPRHPHRTLQQWAQRGQVVLVVPEAADETAYVGPLANVLARELSTDLESSLPVAGVAYAGSGRGGLSVLAVGAGNPGLVLYKPWFDPQQHADDPALVAALGDPTTNPEQWTEWARQVGLGFVWLQSGPEADPLRNALGPRLLDAGPPAKTFLAALEAGLEVLVTPPGAPYEDESPPEIDEPR